MILTTPRLTLREFRFTDLPDLYAIYRDPAARRYEGPVLDEAESSHRLQAIMADQADGRSSRVCDENPLFPMIRTSEVDGIGTFCPC